MERNIEEIKRKLSDWGFTENQYVILEKPFFDMIDGHISYPEKEEVKLHYINQSARVSSNSLEVHTYRLGDKENEMIEFLKKELESYEKSNENIIQQVIENKFQAEYIKKLYVYNITDSVIRCLY